MRDNLLTANSETRPDSHDGFHQRVDSSEFHRLILTQFMTAHTFDAYTVIYFLGVPVDRLHRAAFNTHIAVLADFLVDFRSCLQKKDNRAYNPLVAPSCAA